jgi:hypothetical protein
VDFEAVNNFGDTRSGGLAGPMGLFIIVLMSIATVLLIRNMNKRLRRLPDSFENVDAARRNQEVARLEADLEAPSAAPQRSIIDGDASSAAPPVADPQVSGGPDDVPPPTGARGGDQA